jgi:outer membrane protein assembly factor BamA
MLPSGADRRTGAGVVVRPPGPSALMVVALLLTAAVSHAQVARAETPPSAAAEQPSPPPPEPAPPAEKKPEPPAPATPGPAAQEPAAPPPGGAGNTERPEAQGATAPDSGAPAAPLLIGQIVVDGNIRVSDSAFFSNLHLRKGDPYDEKAIRQEFRRLWDLDLFDDIAVEARRRGSGAIDLIFHVRDRPLVGNVSYVGMKAVTEANIQERLQQGKAEVRRGQPVDFTVLRHAEALIGHMLAEKGYLDARVRARLGPVAQGQRDVVFDIREGGKTKIKKIDFVGNTVYSGHQLRKTLKLTKQANWLTSWASSKPLYHPAKFDQDVENIRTVYKTRGYLDINVLPEVVQVESESAHKERGGAGAPAGAAKPRFEAFDPLSIGDLDEESEGQAAPAATAPAPEGETDKQRKKRLKKEQQAREAETHAAKKRWVYLTVPLDEGAQYRLGHIDVDGNNVFTDRELIARFPLRSGTVYNDSVAKSAIKRMEDDYGERGYFYVSIDPQLQKHDKVVDLRIDVTEDRKYYVDRIEFSGNTSTRDNVLRREMRLQEQQLFNVKLMRLGLRKIAQLGYWQVGGDPAVSPEEESGKVDLQVVGTEASKNEIQVGGGVSGIDGGFFQGSYSTRNFLGKGEVLSAFLQTGARGSRYAINFTEPWFMGHPWSLGFSVFRRQTNYTGFNQLGQGSALNFGRLLGVFSRFDVAYSLEDITFIPTSVAYGTQNSTTTTSSLLAVYSFDTRNNYFRPTRGFRSQSSIEYAGGFLGGDNNFYRFRQDATVYLPGLLRRHYVALNGSYGYIQPFGASSSVPPYDRYFLGGERSLRMFRVRSVGPVRSDEDLNHNGFIDFPEDHNPDGIFEPCEDLNGNGKQDANEPDRGNCRLDAGEDLNHNGILDSEDLNHNGILDPGEDLNGNGILDSEDKNGNGLLESSEDRPDGIWTPFCPPDDPNMNGVRDAGEGDLGNCRLDAGEDTNGDGVFGTVFPGGNKYLQFNAEYSVPVSDTVEFVFFYDAGNAFDDNQPIRLDEMRVDYGLELRFFLPIFQAPLRLIYGFIENPQPGEDSSNFIFSIGTTF